MNCVAAGLIGYFSGVLVVGVLWWLHRQIFKNLRPPRR